MKLKIENMKYRDIVRITNECHECSEQIIFDFNDLKFIEPAGAVVFLSLIDSLKIRGKNVSYITLKNPITKAVSYGCSMGIFQYLGLSNNASYDEGETYIAPKKVLISNINIKEEDYFEEFSSSLTSKILSEKKSDNVYLLVRFIIREIIRNVFDHSQSKYFYYGVQKYNKKSSVELAISDLGVGLRETIPFDAEEEYYERTTDKDAIIKAVIPGISNFTNHTYADEYYKNSGYGLALVKELIERCEGELSIATGETSLTFAKKKIEIDNCFILGTTIRLNINYELLKDIQFNQLIEDVSNDGKSKPSVASKSLDLTNLSL